MARKPFRLETDRLTIRTLARGDVTAFVHYRMLPSVHRYQDWPVPYTRDLAHELVDDMDRLGGPTPNEWVQLAVDAGAGIVGDVAVWLDAAGTFATIGFTIAPEHQGRGFAVEAVTCVIDWLFKRRRVHRIAATIDPRNLASARVLEACGFEYVGTARSAALHRGTWTDDARFSLLEHDWKEWKRRPVGEPLAVTLVDVTHDNLGAVLGVETSFSQRTFVTPVFVSLAEALVPPIVRGETVKPWFRAIEADGEIVGFVMVAEPHEGTPHPYLWRLAVSRRHQRRGIGRRAVELVVEHQRAAGRARLLLSYVPEVPGNPAGFYARLGFVATGNIVDGEVEAALDLAN